MKKKISYRIEEDSLGKVKVPKDALYGAQTQRALNNFQIDSEPFQLVFIQQLASLKGACAIANYKSKLMTGKLSKAIYQSAIDISKNILDYRNQFLVSIYQTGSGTSTNMNMNEVLANLVKKKVRQKIHPNDDINKSQSSNDVIPSTTNICCSLLAENLSRTILNLCAVIIKKGYENKDVIKSGRTHLMDAVPLSFEQELLTWGLQLGNCGDDLNWFIDECELLPIGGTAIGTGINSPKRFGKDVCLELNKITKSSYDTNIKFESINPNERGSMISSQDHILAMSGALLRTSSSLTKICNDLRWMNSGPISGLSEITLKPLQPGSSIMPGKINPVILESILMATAKVVGNHQTITTACLSGNFQLNTMLPIIAHSIIDSFYLLTNSCSSLIEVVETFKINTENIKQNLEKNPVVATKLNEIIGYDLAAKIVKEAYKSNKSIIDVAERMTNLSKSQLKKLFDPKKLI